MQLLMALFKIDPMGTKPGSANKAFAYPVASASV